MNERPPAPPRLTLPRRPLVWMAALALLGGCVTVGRKFTLDGLDKVQLRRTTPEETVAIFGEPYLKQARSDGGVEFKYHIHAFGQGTVGSVEARRLVLEFTGETLNGYLFRSSWEADSTDFDLEARSRITRGKSTRDEAMAILGAPHGKVLLPSSLQKLEFHSIIDTTPPPGASEALIYNFVRVVPKGNHLHKHVKVLVLYVSDDGGIVDLRHFEGVPG